MSTLNGAVTLLEGLAFAAESQSGYTMTLDASPAGGGQGRGPTPMELLVLALGGCTGMDVIAILRKMRQEVIGYRVQVHAERAETHPQVLTSLTVEHIVTGRGLDEAAVRRAVDLSANRYCPVAAMLREAAPITFRYRLIDADSGAETVADLAGVPGE